MSQTDIPVTPGGVRLSHVDVFGGYKASPGLTAVDNVELDHDFDFGPIPMLLVSSFYINYIVENCGVGMTLLEGTYDQSNTSNVEVFRERAATPGLSGTFDLSFGGREIRQIPADASDNFLEELLEANFPEEGGMCTIRHIPRTSCTCDCWLVWPHRDND